MTRVLVPPFLAAAALAVMPLHQLAGQFTLICRVSQCTILFRNISNTFSDGSGVNPAGLTVTTAVRELSGQSNSAYFVSNISASPSVSSGPPSPVSIKQKNVLKLGARTPSGSESSSPRTEWRQKFRLTSDIIQLNADTFSGHGFSSSATKVRPSSAPRSTSQQHAPQPPLRSKKSETQAHEANVQALVKGHSVKVTMHVPIGAAGACTTVVPAPSLL
jgi:hypothetical protein